MLHIRRRTKRRTVTRLNYLGLSMIKIERRDDGHYQATKPLPKGLTDSISLIHDNVAEVKKFVKKKRKEQQKTVLNFVSYDIFNGLKSPILICYFAGE